MGQPQSKKQGVKFRVIGAGMSRTGTKTLNEALQILLKGPCHDSGVQSTGGDRKQTSQWLEVMELTSHKNKTWAEKKKIQYLLADLMEGYVATMDCPAALLAPELMETFPDAIVIATTRDSKSWWKSMQFVTGLSANFYLPILLMWVPRVSAYGIWLMKFRKLALYRYGVDQFDESSLEMHEDHLRRVVPPEKLFWYEVKQGWEPLCKILNVPVPDTPFPHNNSKKEAQQAHDGLVMIGCMYWALVLGGLYGAYWLFWKGLIWRQWA